MAGFKQRVFDDPARLEFAELSARGLPRTDCRRSSSVDGFMAFACRALDRLRIAVTSAARMASKIPNPLAAPAELVSALRYLPQIAENTASMARDTRALAKLERDMAEVARRMEGVTTMDERMANIEATMPVLVDVQKDLAMVPEIIAKLDDRIAKLAILLEELSASVEGLQRSITPLGRIAGRLPGASKPGKHEVEADART